MVALFLMTDHLRRIATSDAELGFALRATAYIGLVPTLLGNLFYLFGVSRLGAATTGP